MTQTTSEFRLFHRMMGFLPNASLIASAQAPMLSRIPVWTEAEPGFAERCQAALCGPEAGLATGVLPVCGPCAWAAAQIWAM